MGSQNIDNEELIRLKHRLYKRMSSGKPEPVCIYIRRSLNTGVSVLDLLRDIPFESLSVSLYFITKGSIKKLSRIYEAELELAAIDADKFLRGIHKFYNETAIYLKKNGLFREFFTFMHAVNRTANSICADKESPISEKVMGAYLSILLQQLEYLRPNKFNFATRVCGLKLDGSEVLTCQDYMPEIDTITENIEKASFFGKSNRTSKAGYLRCVHDEFAKYGYQVSSLDDMEHLTERDRVVCTQNSTMLPFINEYTYDIVGAYISSVNCSRLATLRFSLDLSFFPFLKEKLRHRNKMLPTNGQVFEMVELKPEKDLKYVFFKRFLLREMFLNDKLFLLYKAETICGEYCGYYEPMNEDFFTVMETASAPLVKENMEKIVLYLYGSCVLKEGPDMLRRLPLCAAYHFSETEQHPSFQIPFFVRPIARGGKVRPSYGDGVPQSRGARKGDEQYKEETRVVQGYIRKLGPGRSPSREAIERAAALGFSLELNETYVQPHFTTVYIKRKSEL